MLRINEEAARCLLCADAACTKECGKGMKPGRAVRAVRFENTVAAVDFLDSDVCSGCEGSCESACIHYDIPIRIREMAAKLKEYKRKGADSFEPDLSINFCGVHCENPFFLSSSIVAGDYEMCARALEAGWGGVVFKTVGFFMPDEVSPRFDITGEHGRPFDGFKNLEQISEHSLEYNLDVFRRLKKNYPDKVLIASIMGQTDEEWTELSRLVTEAGADIIECNFSCPQMTEKGMGSDVGQSPELVRKYTELVKKGTNIPVLAKMTPNIGNMEIPAAAAAKGGADGIAAINTIKCILGVDESSFVSQPPVAGKCSVSGYSGKAVKPIALRFISDLAHCRELEGLELSGMGGIESWKDAFDFIALGCRNIQVTTAVMQYGYRIIDDMISGFRSFMLEHGIHSVEEIVGRAVDKVVSADELDRRTVIFPRFRKDQCLGCGRCVISCNDGGHQALELLDGRVHFMPKKCVGCHLCVLVCPGRAIDGGGKRIPKLNCNAG